MSERNKTREKAEKALGKSKTTINRVIRSGERLNAAKLRKEEATATLRAAQAAQAQLALEKEKGALVPRAEVDENFFSLGAEVKAKLRAWAGSLPGRLEGLTAGAMVPVIEEEVSAVLKTLSRE